MQGDLEKIHGEINDKFTNGIVDGFTCKPGSQPKPTFGFHINTNYTNKHKLSRNFCPIYSCRVLLKPAA